MAPGRTTMEKIVQLCADARQCGYIRLSALSEVLAADNGYARQALERLYSDSGCFELSGKSFDEIIQSVQGGQSESLRLLMQGPSRKNKKNEVDREQQLLEELRAIAAQEKGEAETGRPEDVFWRAAIWTWILRSWGGIENTTAPTLSLYYRTPSGDFAPIGSTFQPNWHHNVRLDDLRSLFSRHGIPLPGRLFSDGR